MYDSHADVLLLSIPNVIPDHYQARPARAALPGCACCRTHGRRCSLAAAWCGERSPSTVLSKPNLP